MHRWLLLNLLCVLTLRSWAETRVGAVVAVDPAGTIELRHLDPRGEGAWMLRFPAERPPTWRPGQAVRLYTRSYGGEEWLEQGWPLRPEVAAALLDPEWWRRQGRPVPASDPPWKGFLGVDATGAWTRWGEQEFVHGFILVPFVPEGGATAAVPPALAQAARLRTHLALTEHRDLPWVLWSMQPSRDSVAASAQWAAALWGEAASGVRWVSPCEEFVPAWQDWLGIPLFQVEGQPPVHVPQWFLIDPAGRIAARYEGWEWPLDRLEKTLDAALLKP